MPPLTRRTFVRTAGLGGTSLLALSLGQAQDAPVAAPDLITSETQRLIDNGLAYLARSQANDGSFWDNNGANTAVTGLAALALMAGGHQPGRGTFGRTITRAMEFLATRALTANPVGYITGSEGGFGHAGGMYQHAFATLALSEIYGMVADADRQRRLRDAFEKAVRLIITSQNKQGGWRYDPRPSEADVSVTVAQLMALRAARNAGIFVPKSTVDAAVDYIKGCQLADGGFCYIKGQEQSGSGFPRSAAAVVGLFSAGIYSGPNIDRGMRYLFRFIPNARGQRDFFTERYYFYAHYYAALAMWTAGGQYWNEWFPAIRDDLIVKARGGPQGLWQDYGHGSAYATAMACVILQLPNNYLPILQK